MQTTRHTFIKGLLIALTLMILGVAPTAAQGVAEVWLDKAAEKLQYKGTEIMFRINEEGIRISGKLLIDSQKFVYDTDDMKIWYDGTTQWTLQMASGYNELYINNPSIEEQHAINPYLLLSSYKEYFTATDGGEKNLNGKPVHLVKLQANNKHQEAGSVNLYMTSDGTLAQLEFIAQDGQLYKIEIRSMRSGLTFPKDTFTYQSNEYPADEVVDLR